MINRLVTLLEEKSPLVVGTVSVMETLRHLADSPDVPCDVVEARIDLMSGKEKEALSCCKEIEVHGKPVIVTIRLAVEGGKWTDNDESRKDLFLNALETVSAIDIELRSKLLPQIYATATRQNRFVIISFHDFNKTPELSELDALLEKVKVYSSAILKIAVRAETPDELERIKTFLQKANRHKICTLCMGKFAEESRVSLPVLGSCLTYGYIDQPVAPRQPDCRFLQNIFGKKAK